MEHFPDRQRWTLERRGGLDWTDGGRTVRAPAEQLQELQELEVNEEGGVNGGVRGSGGEVEADTGVLVRPAQSRGRLAG